MSLPTTIVAGNPGHIGHHNDIHAQLNATLEPDPVTIYVSLGVNADDANDGLSPWRGKATLAGGRAAVAALTGGKGRLQLLHGTFDYTSALGQADSVHVEGLGSTLTTLNMTTAGMQGITNATPGTRLFGTAVRGVKIVGPGGQATTVAAGSAGVDVSTFAGAGVLNVVDTTGFASSGTVTVPTANTGLVATITYTGVTGTSFTGCTTTAGSGVLALLTVVHTSGSIGLDILDTATSDYEDIIVTGFAVGVRLHGLSGYTTYNRLFEVDATSCAVGWQYLGLSSNSNPAWNCRANNCSLRGVDMYDCGNDNLWFAGQVEGCGVGSYQAASVASRCDRNGFKGTRFEGNTTAWIVESTTVRDAVYDDIYYSGNGAIWPGYPDRPGGLRTSYRGAGIGQQFAASTRQLDGVQSHYLRVGAAGTLEQGVYRNVISTGYFGGATVTGTLKISLPTAKRWSSSLIQVTIKGGEYASPGGQWTVTIYGYNNSGTGWNNHSGRIDGRPPFSSVRLADDGTDNCILLGVVGTVWHSPVVTVTEVIVGYNNPENWESDWLIAWITSEAGIANIVTVDAQGAAITSPTAPSAGYVQAEAASMKTAIDDIRAVLTKRGITA